MSLEHLRIPKLLKKYIAQNFLQFTVLDLHREIAFNVDCPLSEIIPPLSNLEQNSNIVLTVKFMTNIIWISKILPMLRSQTRPTMLRTT